MTLFDRIKWIFWNRDEHRLRAIWRIGTHTVASFVLTTAFIFGLMIITLIVDAIFGAGLGQNLNQADAENFSQIPWFYMVIVPAATFLGIWLATLMTGKFIDRRKFQAFGLKFSKRWWLDLAFGLILGALLMALIFIFGWLTGNVRVIGFFRPYNPDLSFHSGFFQALVFFIFVGIYEELLSRGYHLINLSEGFNHQSFGSRWAIVLAVLVSALVFGLLHIRNPNASWVSTLNITIAGIVFGLGMIFTGRLAIPIGLHITWNFFQGNVFGLPVSGVRNGATIIATEVVGPEWLTGGAFGPEAGLMGLVALLLAGLLIFLWIRRKGPLSLQTELANFDSPDREIKA
jgi:uncharacterized protein